MFRYSGPLLSFVVIAICLGINIVRYPTVWEMVDQTTFAVKFASQEQKVDDFDEYVTSEGPAESQIVQTEIEPKADFSREGTPVPPPLGGSPSSSTRTLFTTNLSKAPPENVSSNGYEPIPAYAVPNRRIADLASPPEVEEEEVAAEFESEWTEEEEEEEEEDLSDYQPVLSQPVYAARPEQQPAPPAEEPRELTPEEKVEAFKNTPLDLMPANGSESEFSRTPEWL